MVQCASQSFLWKNIIQLSCREVQKSKATLEETASGLRFGTGRKRPVWRFLLRGNHFQLPQKTYQEDVQKINQLRWKFFIWYKSWKPSLNPEKTGWILFLLVAHEAGEFRAEGWHEKTILASHESDIFENGNVFCLQVVYLYNMTFGMTPWVFVSRSCFAHGEWVWWR